MSMFNDVYATPSYGTPESHPTVRLTSTTGCTCGGLYVGDFPPPPCAMHAWPAWHDARPLTFQSITQRLHPDDIEAIARRVAELLKATP